MKRLFLWLNLVVAVCMTVGFFSYSARLLSDDLVDPRPDLVRMARSTGYGSFLIGCVGLLFVVQTIGLLRRKDP